MVRPPFYPVLNLSDEYLKEFVPTIPIESWAYALFNTSKDLRIPIEKVFTEKQRFLFIEHIKKIDRPGFNHNIVFEAREFIAVQLRSFLASKPIPRDESKMNVLPSEAVIEKGKQENSNVA